MKTLTKMKKVCCFNRFVLLAMTLSMVTSLLHVAVTTIRTFPYIPLKMLMAIIPAQC